MRAGFERMRTVRRTVRRHGKRRSVRRRVTVLAADGARPLGQTSAGRRPARQPRRPGHRRRRGARALELRRSPRAARRRADRPTATAATATRPPAARTARCGSPTRDRRSSCPPERAITMSVPAQTSLRVNRQAGAERAGRDLQRDGCERCRCPPAASSSSCRSAYRVAGRRSALSRTDGTGAGRSATASSARRGVQHFRFRARLPGEASYPFVAGRSRSLTVRVRGRVMSREQHAETDRRTCEGH